MWKPTTVMLPYMLLFVNPSIDKFYKVCYTEQNMEDDWFFQIWVWRWVYFNGVVVLEPPSEREVAREA